MSERVGRGGVGAERRVRRRLRDVDRALAVDEVVGLVDHPEREAVGPRGEHGRREPRLRPGLHARGHVLQRLAVHGREVGGGRGRRVREELREVLLRHAGGRLGAALLGPAAARGDDGHGGEGEEEARRGGVRSRRNGSGGRGRPADVQRHWRRLSRCPRGRAPRSRTRRRPPRATRRCPSSGSRPSGRCPLANSDASASRQTRSPSLSSRWISTSAGASVASPARERRERARDLLDGRDEHLGELRRPAPSAPRRRRRRARRRSARRSRRCRRAPSRACGRRRVDRRRCATTLSASLRRWMMSCAIRSPSCSQSRTSATSSACSG